MQCLPRALAREILAAHSRFRCQETTDAERNTLVAELLTQLREIDPNISVWDLLPIFDSNEWHDECPRCGLLNGHRYPCVG